MDLTNQLSYKIYFQGLVTSHVDLHWFKFGDDRAVREDGSDGMSDFGLWADEHEPVKIRDDRSDNILGQYKATLMIMKPKPQKTADHQAAYDDAELLVLDIISKLQVDYTTGAVATAIGEYQYGKAEHTQGGTEFTGCRLDITWLAPVDITYRANKWT